MERGLYIAASGMLAELVRQDQIANDLSNASTPGYKADRSAQQSFGDMLLANRKSGETIGTLGLGTQISQIRTDLTQAPLRETDEPLDLALQGDGFFAVKTTQGVRYTQDGQFSLDATGQLVNQSGYAVLDDKNQPIKLGATDGVTIADGGAITLNGRAVATIGVVSLTDAQKQGDTLFTGKPGARPAGTAVRQGYLEGAGVDAAKAMVDMMVSMRAYEAGQRVIHAIDETLQKGISSGGFGGG
jgi:flagellar basal-body rod protein FlgG